MLRAGQSARRDLEQGHGLEGRLAPAEDDQGWYQSGGRTTG